MIVRKNFCRQDVLESGSTINVQLIMASTYWSNTARVTSCKVLGL